MSTGIIQLRHTLHQHPELSGLETASAGRIKEFLRNFGPTKILERLGGTGIAAVYRYSDDGPVLVIRCELDALPITETTSLPYQSEHHGIAHSCGHDGHMAIVAGLAPWLQQQAFGIGTVVLLFQPAEETGEGAQAVLQDVRFQTLQPEYIFALHNIPGVPLGTVICHETAFSATVQSLIISLTGKESHAAEPEKGRNPARALAELVLNLEQLVQDDETRSDFALLTPVCLKLGQQAYGIAPGSGELHLTLRTWSEAAMSSLKSMIVCRVDALADRSKLQYSLEWLQYFPAAGNQSQCTELLKEAARHLDLPLQVTNRPHRFGEDFGWYSKDYKTVMFGLGAGIGHPSLHDPAYDFPDDLLLPGQMLFKELIKDLLNG